MPKLSEVMGPPPQATPPAAAPQAATPPPGRVKLSQVMGTAPPVFDMAPIHSRPTPQQEQLTFPERPFNGADMLAWARWKQPDLAGVPDQDLARMIRQTYYPGMDAAEFYRTTGFDRQFGLDTGAPDPTAGMSGVDLGLSGAGKFFVDTARGARQLGAEGLEKVGLVDEATTADLRRQEGYRRELDAPLMDTGAGQAGYLGGALLTGVGPGVALRGTAVGGALLPASVTGNAAMGAAYGAVQPVTEGESRSGNVVKGALLGGGATAGIKGAVMAGGAARRLLPAMTERAQTRAAGEVLEKFAQNPAAVRQALAQPGGNVIVAGTRPTTAEVTEDVGLGGLQRYLANTPEYGPELTLVNEANNRARVAAVENAFGGANAARAEALTEARDLGARQALRPIAQTGIGSVDPVRQAVTRIGIRYQSAPAVREAMAAIDAELPRIQTVGDAHQLRQYIGQLMSGQIEGKAGAKLAQAQLATVRNVLDRQMRQAFPQWGNFLRDYKAASREIGQVNVGETLLGAGPNVRAVGDIPQLSAPKFAGAVDDLDRTVRQATGFKRAKADKALTPQQLQTADEVRRDLERYARTQQRGTPVGSPTMANAIGGNRIQDAMGPVGAAMIDPTGISPTALLLLNAARKKYGENTYQIVREAMLRPERAAEVLASLPPVQQRELAAVLALTGRGAVVTGARTSPTLTP